VAIYENHLLSYSVTAICQCHMMLLSEGAILCVYFDLGSGGCSGSGQWCGAQIEGDDKSYVGQRGIHGCWNLGP
jgi:hypothetical protein